MIDDPKLERLVEATRVAGRNKTNEEEGVERIKARLPRMEELAKQAATEYEAALSELAEYIRSQ